MPKIEKSTIDEAAIRGLQSMQNKSNDNQDTMRSDIDFALALLGADESSIEEVEDEQ